MHEQQKQRNALVELDGGNTLPQNTYAELIPAKKKTVAA